MPVMFKKKTSSSVIEIKLIEKPITRNTRKESGSEWWILSAGTFVHASDTINDDMLTLEVPRMEKNSEDQVEIQDNVSPQKLQPENNQENGHEKEYSIQNENIQQEGLIGPISMLKGIPEEHSPDIQERSTDYAPLKRKNQVEDSVENQIQEKSSPEKLKPEHNPENDMEQKGEVGKSMAEHASIEENSPEVVEERNMKDAVRMQENKKSVEDQKEKQPLEKSSSEKLQSERNSENGLEKENHIKKQDLQKYGHSKPINMADDIPEGTSCNVVEEGTAKSAGLVKEENKTVKDRTGNQSQRKIFLMKLKPERNTKNGVGKKDRVQNKDLQQDGHAESINVTEDVPEEYSPDIIKERNAEFANTILCYEINGHRKPEVVDEVMYALKDARVSRELCQKLLTHFSNLRIQRASCSTSVERGMDRLEMMQLINRWWRNPFDKGSKELDVALREFFKGCDYPEPSDTENQESYYEYTDSELGEGESTHQDFHRRKRESTYEYTDSELGQKESNNEDTDYERKEKGSSYDEKRSNRSANVSPGLSPRKKLKKKRPLQIREEFIEESPSMKSRKRKSGKGLAVTPSKRSREQESGDTIEDSLSDEFNMGCHEVMKDSPPDNSRKEERPRKRENPRDHDYCQ